MNRFIIAWFVSIFVFGVFFISEKAVAADITEASVSQKEDIAKNLREYDRRGEPHWYGKSAFSILDLNLNQVYLNDPKGESHTVKLPVSEPVTTETHAVSPDGRYIAYSSGIIDRDGNAVEGNCPLTQNAKPPFDQVDLLVWVDEDILMIGNSDVGIFAYILSGDYVKQVTPEFMPPAEVAEALERKENADKEITVEVKNQDGTTKRVSIQKPGEYEHNILAKANAFTKKEGSMGLKPVCLDEKVFYIAIRYTQSFTKRYGLYTADLSGETFLGYLNWAQLNNISIISDGNLVNWFAEDTGLQACTLRGLDPVEPSYLDIGGKEHGIVPDGDSIWVCASIDDELKGLTLDQLLRSETVAHRHHLRLPYGEEVKDLKIIRMEDNSLLYVLILPTQEGEELRLMRLYTEDDTSTKILSIFAADQGSMDYCVSPDGNTLLVQTREKITCIPLDDLQDPRPVFTQEEKIAKQIEEEQKQIVYFREALNKTRWLLPSLLVLLAVLFVLDLTGILHISGKWGLRAAVLVLPSLPVIFLYICNSVQMDFLLLLLWGFGLTMCWLFLMYIFIRSNIQPVRFRRHISKEERQQAKPQTVLSFAATAVFCNVYYLVICSAAGILALAGAGGALSMLFLPVVSFFFGIAFFGIAVYIFTNYVIQVILGVHAICMLNRCLPRKYHNTLLVFLQFIQPAGLIGLVILMRKLRRHVREA